MRITPWPGEVGTALLAPNGQSISIDGEVVDLARTKASELGYEQVLWQATTEFSELVLTGLGFYLRDKLSVLVDNNLRSIGAKQNLPPPDYRLRRAHSREISYVLKLDNTCFEKFWQLNRQGLDDALSATPRSRLRVIMSKDNEIVAYSVFGFGGGTGFLQRLAVEESHRGRGLASALITEGKRWLLWWRCHKLSVNTQTTNTAALTLYRTHGFDLQREGISLYGSPSNP